MTQHRFASLGESADRKMKEIADTSREKLETIKRKSFQDVYRDTRKWVGNNPVKTLVGAVTTGVLIGWVLRRK